MKGLKKMKGFEDFEKIQKLNFFKRQHSLDVSRQLK